MMKEKGIPLSEFSINPQKTYRGKGGFGDYLEEQFFGKKNDNNPDPDIKNIGVEIKAAPLLEVEDRTVVKERLVLGIINYKEMAKETFETSHFLYKNGCLLLVFHIEDFSPDYGHRLIKLVDLWKTIENDLPQLESDWNTIHQKITEGKAETISEGDTLYLGACTKGATTATSMTEQPFSNVLAKGRALCFKKPYIQSIYERLSEKKKRRDIRLETTAWKPLNQIIVEKVAPYIGMRADRICPVVNRNYNPKNKSLYYDIACGMLGLKGRTINFEEFRSADIQIKAIRVEPNGNIKEAMSFRNIPYCEIINEDWEDSVFYGELVSKFFLFVFKRHKESDTVYTFERVIYWNMPEEDIDKARLVWEDTKEKIAKGDYSHFVKEATKGFEVSHVRPKATTQSPYMLTPQGTMEKKKCFWLNRSYIKKLLSQY